MLSKDCSVLANRCAQESHVACSRLAVSFACVSRSENSTADVRCAVDSEKMHQANSYGYKVPEADTSIDWPTLKAKRDKYIQRLNGIYERSQCLDAKHIGTCR